MFLKRIHQQLLKCLTEIEIFMRFFYSTPLKLSYCRMKLSIIQIVIRFNAQVYNENSKTAVTQSDFALTETILEDFPK